MQKFRKEKEERKPKKRKPKKWCLSYRLSPKSKDSMFRPFHCKNYYPSEKAAKEAMKTFKSGGGGFSVNHWLLDDFVIKELKHKR